MRNIIILKAKLDLLQNLEYESITYLDDGKIRQKTYVSFDKVLKEINSLRKKLSDLGYNYFDEKLTVIKHN